MNFITLYPSLFLVVSSSLVACEAYRLGLGDPHSPGPGFMIFWASVLLGLLAIHLSIRCLVTRQKNRQHVWEGKQWQQSISVFVTLLLYIVLFKPLGYLLATFFLLVVLVKTPRKGKAKWLVIVGSAALTSLITYVVFGLFFSLQFPKGVLNFF